MSQSQNESEQCASCAKRLDGLGLLALLQLGHEQAVLYPGSRPRHLLCKTVFLTIEAEQSCLDFPKRNLCGL